MEMKVSFTSLGHLLTGTVKRPSEVSSAAVPAVVMATGDGLTGSKSPTWRDLGNDLAEAGLASLLFDFQGLGISGGPARELTLSVGLANMADAIALVRNEPWVDASRIGILGSSFGGNVALLYASVDPTIRALALKSPVSFYAEVHEGVFGPEGMQHWKENGYNADYGFDYNMYLESFNHNTYAAAKGVQAEVRIVHGDADTNVPLRQSMRLLECLPKAELIVLPGVDHGYKQPGALESMRASLVPWLAEVM